MSGILCASENTLSRKPISEIGVITRKTFIPGLTTGLELNLGPNIFCKTKIEKLSDGSFWYMFDLTKNDIWKSNQKYETNLDLVNQQQSHQILIFIFNPKNQIFIRTSGKKTQVILNNNKLESHQILSEKHNAEGCIFCIENITWSNFSQWLINDELKLNSNIAINVPFEEAEFMGNLPISIQITG